MALVQLGGGVLDASGSIGGQVFSKNRNGNYIRARTTPVNPNTTRQSVIRAIMAQLAVYWSATLTSVQRAAWEVYAGNITRSNALGAQIKLTGFNHFIRANSVRVQNGDPIVAAGPTTLSLPGADPLFAAVIDEAGQEISVTFDDTLDWANFDDGAMYVFMSEPKNTGVNFIGGPFKLAGVINGLTVGPPVTPATIPVPFPVAEGQEVAVEYRISEVDGRLSDRFRDQSSVIA